MIASGLLLYDNAGQVIGRFNDPDTAAQIAALLKATPALSVLVELGERLKEEPDADDGVDKTRYTLDIDRFTFEEVCEHAGLIHAPDETMFAALQREIDRESRR